VWRDSRDKRLSPNEAPQDLRAQNGAGIRTASTAGCDLVGPAEKYAEPVAQLAKHLGIAFQILNDCRIGRATTSTSSRWVVTCWAVDADRALGARAR